MHSSNTNSATEEDEEGPLKSRRTIPKSMSHCPKCAVPRFHVDTKTSFTEYALQQHTLTAAAAAAAR